MNINRIYDTIEAKVTKITGSRPNATERLVADLGCDSLDTLDIINQVEKELDVYIPNEVASEILSDTTLLDLAVLLTDKLNEK